MNTPQVGAPDAWRTAVDALRVKEKAATRTRDALAAERRRLPMVRIECEYIFDGSYFTTGRGVEGTGGISTLLDLTPLGWRRHDEYGRTARTSR